MNHPCKECLVFVMCQSRLQESINTTCIQRDSYSNEKTLYNDIIILSYYTSIFHCDIFKNYINNILLITLKNNLWYPKANESTVIDALHEAFDIKLNCSISDHTYTTEYEMKRRHINQ